MKYGNHITYVILQWRKKGIDLSTKEHRKIRLKNVVLISIALMIIEKHGNKRLKRKYLKKGLNWVKNILKEHRKERVRD